MTEVILVGVALACMAIGGVLGVASLRHDGPATGHIALAQGVGGAALALPAFLGIGVWLQDKLGWPERYGFTCRGRGCWISDLTHSPVLLGDPGAAQLALFAYFWTIPAAFVATILYLFITKRGIFKTPESE